MSSFASGQATTGGCCGNLDVTLNWSTIKELVDADDDVISRIDVLPSAEIVQELCSKLPDFRKGFCRRRPSAGGICRFWPATVFPGDVPEGLGHVDRHHQGPPGGNRKELRHLKRSSVDAARSGPHWFRGRGSVGRPRTQSRKRSAFCGPSAGGVRVGYALRKREVEGDFS